MDHTISRRGFMTAAAGAAVATRATGVASAPAVFAAGADKLALLGGRPVRGTRLPLLAGRRRARGEGTARGAAQREVVPRRRADGEPVRGGLRAADRRPALHRHRQRHERPLRLARRARRRPGRRGDPPALHLRRHPQRRLPPVRAPRLRGLRPRDVPDGRAPAGGGRHRPHRGDHAGSPRRQRLRPRRDPGGRPPAEGARPGGRLPGAPRRVAGPQAGYARRRRLLQLPGQQEPQLAARAAPS